MGDKRHKSRKHKPSSSSSSNAREPLPVKRIELAVIDPSPLNRDARGIDDLLASIREHGVLEPIKLRPKGERFEIVYGERRWRASRKLGLDTIPANVEDLSAAEAHELRLVENAVRKDAHPLEDAEAWETLLAMKSPAGKPIHTPESLAKLIGRSTQHVYQRLKLTALGPAMRKAFYAGELTTTTAFLVARAVPRELQDEALARFREMFPECGEGEPFPAEDLGHYIEQEYLARLDRAPFSLKDGKLVTQAGPCASCAKRTGNQAVLFADDVPKDVCTDLACFRMKLAAHREKLAAEVLAAGGVVLTDRESNDIYRGSSHLPWNSRFIDVDEPCYDDPERRTWRRLLGDLSPTITLAVDPHGTPHALVVKGDAAAALKQAGVDFEPQRRKGAGGANGSAAGDATGNGADGPAASDETRDPAAARVEAAARRATIGNLLAAVVTAAEARPTDDAEFARLIFHAMARSGFHDAVADTVKRRHLERTKGELPVITLTRHADSLDAKGIRSLILELALARGAYFAWSTTYSEDLSAAAKAYRIDIDAIAKSSAGELEAKRADRAQKRRSSPALEASTPQP
jgi:ParB family chromosome partitioning protein